ncbi:hypothetical protein QKU58_gp086 [Pyramimonas orientalis virus]|uniref:Uncharacterized protein n=1 Tax=Pyramimonas orientalis virus 01B TaxID=3134525 RepID=A0A7M3UNI6_9VIRU|nr:hypothetical protein QKU58_gp086 [Pyramimonas orientalis virus]QOI90245.1 hypothetical protein HWQ62_00108 [Pyramimonas orientalis virus]
MLKILLGFGIVLTILLLTILILSIQHITFSSMFEKSPKEKKVVMKEKNDKDLDIKPVDSKDKVVTSLVSDDQDPEIPQKCCHMQKYDCGNTSIGCISGVEKRCGAFAEKPCEEPMYDCNTLNEDSCKSYPSSIYCEFDETKKRCNTTTINSHGGSDITCEMFDKFITDKQYPNMKYNCENNLLGV